MMLIDDWIGSNVPDAVMDDAAAWLARLDSPQSTQADRAAFARWLNEDPVHQWAFEELSEVWARLRTLADVRPLLDDGDVTLFPQPERRSVGSAPATVAPASDWTALAACVLIAVGELVHVAGRAPSETHVAPVGTAMEVMLDDSSSVTLNARSRIDVRMDGDSRRIYLHSGEALFNVKNDPRPFIVSAGDVTAIAIGTEFAVRQRPGRVDVSVLSGTVSVDIARASPMLTEYDPRDDTRTLADTVLLQSGERLTVSGDRREQQLLSPPEVEKSLSWRNGFVTFEQQPLSLVIDDMRRYLDVNLHIGDAALASTRINGRFRTGDVDGFLDSLQRDFGIVIERKDADWVVLQSPEK